MIGPVAVTGLGVVSAVGIGYADFADSVAAGVTGLEPAAGGRLLARVLDFRVADYLVAEKTYLDRCSEFALAAVKLCLDDAGLGEPPVPEERRGLVLGTAYGCAGTMETYRQRVQQRGMRFATPVMFSHAFANTPASLLAIDFRLRGYHATVTSGWRSGELALATAVAALAAGHADAVLAGGCDALTPLVAEWLDDGLARADDPLDWDPTAADAGLALGEGAAVLLLERCADAVARGARVRARLTIDAAPADLTLLGDAADSAPEALYGHALGASGALAAACGVVARARGLQPPVRAGDEPLEARWEPRPMTVGSVGVGELRLLAAD